jgi:hypothetical protein
MHPTWNVDQNSFLVDSLVHNPESTIPTAPPSAEKKTETRKSYSHAGSLKSITLPETSIDSFSFDK